MTCTYTDLPKLGFGFMRLPEVEGADGAKEIDLGALCDMVDTFMDAGFTYFDTARGYHGGRSAALREALVKRYPRASFQVATKLPAWLAKDAGEARTMFETSLDRRAQGISTSTSCTTWATTAPRPSTASASGTSCAASATRASSSTWASPSTTRRTRSRTCWPRTPDVEFVQLQINYADWESETIESRACYEVARAHGLPVVVMEPIKGGSLVKLPEAAAGVLRAADANAPLASWALRFAASLPGALTVLSGMSTPEQVRENVAVMRAFEPLTCEEQAAIDHVRAILDGIPHGAVHRLPLLP